MASKSKDETTHADTTKIVADDDVDTDADADARETAKSSTMVASHHCDSRNEFDNQSDFESHRSITGGTATETAVATPNVPYASTDDEGEENINDDVMKNILHDIEEARRRDKSIHDTGDDLVENILYKIEEGRPIEEQPHHLHQDNIETSRAAQEEEFNLSTQPGAVRVRGINRTIPALSSMVSYDDTMMNTEENENIVTAQLVEEADVNLVVPGVVDQLTINGSQGQRQQPQRDDEETGVVRATVVTLQPIYRKKLVLAVTLLLVSAIVGAVVEISTVGSSNSSEVPTQPSPPLEEASAALSGCGIVVAQPTASAPAQTKLPSASSTTEIEERLND